MIPPSPPTDADSLADRAAARAWRLAPLAMWQLDGDGRVRAANAAAQRLAGASPDGRPLDEVLGLPPADARRLAESVASVASAAHDGPASVEVEATCGGAPSRWRLDLQAGGADLVLAAASPCAALAAARADARRLGELLDVAQDFGRLGVWERDLRTGVGRWDRHVWRFWGIEPRGDAPTFEEAAASIPEADRALTDPLVLASMRQSGIYECRFRVRQPDGSMRHLHSQWTVRDGDDGRPDRMLGVMVDDTEAWQLAQAHGEAASQLAMAADLSHLGLWRHDLARRHLHFSLAGFRMLGLAPRDGGVPLDELRAMIHPDDLPAVRAGAMKALAQTAPVDIVARHRLPDGRWRHILTRRVVQRDPQGGPTAFLGVMLDTTEQVEAARRSDELALRFELATRTAGLGWWTLEGGEERGVWSDEMRAIHGLPEGAPVPTREEWLRDFVIDEDRDRVRALLAEWDRLRRSNLEMSLHVRRPDGDVRELQAHQRSELDGPAPWRFGIVIDVTERRSAERALRETTERAALAARAVGIGTWEYEPSTGRTHWDEQMWRLRGLEPRLQPLDHAARRALVHPDDRSRVDELSREIEQGDRPTAYEFRVVLPDGQVRWLASRSIAVAEHGRPLRRIGVNWDVTDRRQAESDRQERELAQRESQAKSRFLTRVSHELRTPLNAVLGFAQLLLADPTIGSGSDGAGRRRQIEHIETAGRHLLALINDVLDLTSLDSGELVLERQAVDLDGLVDETLPLIEPQRLARRLRLRRGPLGLAARGDRVRLRQVLLNLLSNAVKYNRDEGEIVIAAEADGDAVVLRVRDSGRGMDAEQRRHLFEPFNRLGIEREGIEGTGVGLAIARSIVERLGGTLSCDSEPGVGSEFRVRLPRAPAPPPAPMAKSAAVAAPAGDTAVRQRTVLYVEDNPVNAMIIVELLGRRPKYRVETAATGMAGLERARALRPHLVLLDMQLPDIDGHEVFARLRADAATAHIPCVALSANAMPADIERALAAGMVDYWTKPLDLAAFAARVDALLACAG